MNLGERIARLRRIKGLSQDELADLLGVSRGAISMYEINKREPDYETLEKLATFFGVSTDYLLGREGTPNNEKSALSSAAANPQVKRLYDVISRAEDLPDENVEQIADTIEALINYHKTKNLPRKDREQNSK